MFQFDDYYFRQIQGREMGNPFTCMWAVAHFALVEHLILDSRHKSNIIVLVRFIDDTFVIWKKIETQPDCWKGFKRCLNQASNLNWFCKNLGERRCFWI